MLYIYFYSIYIASKLFNFAILTSQANTSETFDIIPFINRAIFTINSDGTGIIHLVIYLMIFIILFLKLYLKASK